MQKQLSSWRKELSIIAEIGRDFDNGKLNRKKERFKKIYRVTNVGEFAQLKETLKQKVQTKAQRIRRYEKSETWYSRNKMFNPLSPELNPICYLLALLAHHFLHVSRIRVKSLTLR